MDLDVNCLLEAKVENVERLALALGVRLPVRTGRHDFGYARKLARLVLKQIERDRRGAKARNYELRA